jgi:hypothetical protein
VAHAELGLALIPRRKLIHFYIEGIRCDNECPEDHGDPRAIITPLGPTRYSNPRSPLSCSSGLAAFATAAATATGTAGSNTDGMM